jgi:hypothetical protein
LTQAPSAGKEEASAPAPNQIGEARKTLVSFAGRLNQLADARREFDDAIQEERGMPKFSAADLLARGEDPLDAGAILNRRARAEIRLRGFWDLSEREAGPAMFALLAIRGAASSAVKQASDHASTLVDEAMPDYFTGDARKRAIAESTPVREAALALQAVEYLARYSVPASKGEYGIGWRLPAYRTGAVPEKCDPRRDLFDPSATIGEINSVLEGHDAALRFLVAMFENPTTARWTP